MPPKGSVNPELDAILARPENRVCADCGARAPRWASVNLGIFVCMECSGTHRSLGTHISTVKSTSLDKWPEKWIATCSAIGNESSNCYYESRLPKDYQRPRDGDSRDKIKLWIANKYERRDYCPRGKPSPSELLAQGKDPGVYGGAEAAQLPGRPASTSRAQQPAAAQGAQEATDLLGIPDGSAPAAASSVGTGLLPAPPPASTSAADGNWATFDQQQPAALEVGPLGGGLESLDFFAEPAPGAPATSSSALSDAHGVQQPAAVGAPSGDQAEQQIAAVQNALSSLYHQPAQPGRPQNGFHAFSGLSPSGAPLAPCSGAGRMQGPGPLPWGGSYSQHHFGTPGLLNGIMCSPGSRLGEADGALAGTGAPKSHDEVFESALASLGSGAPPKRPITSPVIGPLSRPVHSDPSALDIDAFSVSGL